MCCTDIVRAAEARVPPCQAQCSVELSWVCIHRRQRTVRLLLKSEQSVPPGFGNWDAISIQEKVLHSGKGAWENEVLPTTQ